MKLFLPAAMAIVLAAAPAPVCAAYLVDTGTPAPGSDRYTLYNEGSTYQYLAGQFILTESATIGSIESYVYAAEEAPLGITVYQGANVVLSQTFDTTVGTSWQGLKNLDLTLSAAAYWVVFSSNQPRLVHGLVRSVPNPLPAYQYYSEGSNGWQPLDPYPGFALRIAEPGDVEGAVPEPASWALMIGGLALVGGALRRQRASVRFA